MEPVHVTHLILLSAWGGLLIAEGIVEISARDDATRRHVARLHYWMDLLLELPLIVGVLITGGLLLASRWPPSALLWTKILLGLMAIGVNLFCVAMVIFRMRRLDDANALRRYSYRIRLSGAAVPFGLAAATLGLVYFRG